MPAKLAIELSITELKLLQDIADQKLANQIQSVLDKHGEAFKFEFVLWHYWISGQPIRPLFAKTGRKIIGNIRLRSDLNQRISKNDPVQRPLQHDS